MKWSRHTTEIVIKMLGRQEPKVYLFLIVCLFWLASDANAQLSNKVVPITVPHAGAKATNFNPKVNGFRFVNSFKNDAVPALNIETDGLCGGMSYSALDYYFAHLPIPPQAYRPANRTPLQSYLYNREVDSLLGNGDKWIEVGFNPSGARNSEFFHWGLQGSGGGRLQELRDSIDRGVPIPLGLQGEGKTGNHQVVAIGYDMGRYNGDLGQFQEDLKIFVYDPNDPGRTRILVPDLVRQVYTFDDDRNETWRTYFVDRKYSPKTPPAIDTPVYPADGKVHELILTFHTGSDDLRGGQDNINLEINLLDGSRFPCPNVNQSARWLPNYTENARIVLPRPIYTKEIGSLVLRDTFSGGFDGDNWNMDSVTVSAVVGGVADPQTIAQAGPKYFKGDDRELTIPVNLTIPSLAGQVGHLMFVVRTANDDLRGGSDNLDVEIQFVRGRKQTAVNVNHSAHWDNNSEHSFVVDLVPPVAISDIEGITLRTTFGGGIGGDNWNMDSVTVTAMGNGVNKSIAGHGFNRFTGDQKSLALKMNH